MADLERTYNIPLRKEVLKVPRYQRAKKAMTAVKQFISKHMKSDDVLVGQALNMELWKHGIKNPPHHVKVTAIKDSDDLVKVELEGIKYETLKQKEKKEDDTSLMGRLKDKMGPDEEDDKNKSDSKAPNKTKAKKEAPKVDAKEDVPKAEVKKEAPKVDAKEDVPKAEKKE